MIGYNVTAASAVISVFALSDWFDEFLVASNSADQRRIQAI